MAWQKIVKEGTVIVEPSGRVIISGFDFEGSDCREAVRLGIAWAIQKLAAAQIEGMTADRPKLSAID